jgi:hypothetical protein
MSTIAITSLPVVTTGLVGDIFPIVQNNVTSQITNANLFNSVATLNGLKLSRGTGNVGSNIAIGDDSLLVNTTGSGNTAVGDSTLKANTIGIDNTGMGRGALLTNVSGSYNVGIGALAFALTTGSYNTGIGRNAGGSISSGSKNTIIGNYSGNGGGLDIRTASNYVVLSDGDGNPRAYWNGADATFGGGLSLGGLVATNAVAPTVPSGSTITPLGSINFISGTTVVNNISALGNIAYTGGSVTLIPTGVWTWTTAGNIALAGTAVVSKALIMTYDYGTGKWYPSYV